MKLLIAVSEQNRQLNRLTGTSRACSNVTAKFDIF